MASPDIDALYGLLRDWALHGNKDTYTALSGAYKVRTGHWFEPHGSWDFPLGEVNKRCHAIGAPALSAVVVLAGPNGEPGGGFWGCAGNVPPRPSDAMERLLEWARILKAVHAYKWPSQLPTTNA